MTRAWTVLSVVAFAGIGFARADKIVWTDGHVVDKPLRFVRTGLSVRPGAKIVFRGEGRIILENASFKAEGALFEADSVLTNAFRVEVSGGRLDMSRCRVSGVKTHEPRKGRCFIVGAFWSQYGNDSRLVGNDFSDSSAVTYANASDVIVRDNLFLRADGTGVGILHVVRPVVERNEFMLSSVDGLNLNVVEDASVMENRFTDCVVAINVRAAKSSRFSGNSVFGGGHGFSFRVDGGRNVVVGNLFEKLKGFAVLGWMAFGGRTAFLNNLVVGSGGGFSFVDQPKSDAVALCNNAVVESNVGYRLAGGEVRAMCNAAWRVKSPVEEKSGAEFRGMDLVTGDPMFRNAADGDYRLAPGSAWRGVGRLGANVGLYQ